MDYYWIVKHKEKCPKASFQSKAKGDLLSRLVHASRNERNQMKVSYFIPVIVIDSLIRVWNLCQLRTFDIAVLTWVVLMLEFLISGMRWSNVINSKIDKYFDERKTRDSTIAWSKSDIQPLAPRMGTLTRPLKTFLRGMVFDFFNATRSNIIYLE